MIDALDPFVRALADGADLSPDLATAWRNALPAAEAGAAGTANLVAKRGRSARLGERSLGHVDPGATSMVYLFQAVGQALDTVCGENG